MTRVLGSVTPNGQNFDIGFERVLDTDIDDAWDAVTNPDRLQRWMTRYEGAFAVDGQWRALHDDGSVYATGRIIACNPPHSFVTTWHAVKEKETVLTVTLDETSDGTRLHLRHVGAISVHIGTGWQTYLEQLDDLLGPSSSSAVDPERQHGVTWNSRFAQLHAAYTEQYLRP